MYEPEAVARVEKALEGASAPLLTGGSVHGDILNGGAVEGRFCVSRWGWSRWLGGGRWAAPILFLCTHPLVPVRLAALAAIELALAGYDFIRGVLAGRDLWNELKFVPGRVAVSGLLREFFVLGAAVDVARGLPVVHLNFFGYDEQAHLRGPGSAFALWTLKGIDGAIRRVWEGARRAGRRPYDVWIYSDHGQEEVALFTAEKGRTAAEAVSDALGTPVGSPGGPVMAAMGPLGHVYLPSRPAAEGVPVLAERLVRAGFPLVLAAPGGKARAWTEEGSFALPEESALVLGAEHPFAAEAGEDLARLSRHVDAGDFIIGGWRKEGKPLTLSVENGAHGGPGPEEMEAFALLPSDAPLRDRGAAPRLLDLRHAALRFLGRPPDGAEGLPGPRPRRGLRLMTYNVHGCVGMDGRLAPERIARVIARQDPDVVALQELDVGRRRSGGMDQAGEVARLLGMSAHFHPAVAMEEEKYGDAVLGRVPLRLVRTGVLLGRRGNEPRGALWVEVMMEGKPLQVINTHLSLWPGERLSQAESLLGPDWLGDPRAAGPAVLCGDFNARPGSQVCRRLGARLRDAQLELAGRRPRGTWFGRWPMGRIDHVYLGEGLRVREVIVPATELDKTASDHLPLVVDLEWL
jgi:endonuclease/exonuclease/phosphatase family metal-dependent hydrolase